MLKNTGKYSLNNGYYNEIFWSDEYFELKNNRAKLLKNEMSKDEYLYSLYRKIWEVGEKTSMYSKEVEDLHEWVQKFFDDDFEYIKKHFYVDNGFK